MTFLTVALIATGWLCAGALTIRFCDWLDRTRGSDFQLQIPFDLVLWPFSLLPALLTLLAGRLRRKPNP